MGGIRKSDHGALHRESMRLGYQRSGVSDKPSEETVAFNEKFNEIQMRECVNCGSTKVAYKWHTFGFCSEHKSNASLFMKAFPNFVDLRKVGLYREWK